jgi:hypothetical protein
MQDKSSTLCAHAVLSNGVKLYYGAAGLSPTLCVNQFESKVVRLP